MTLIDTDRAFNAPLPRVEVTAKVPLQDIADAQYPADMLASILAALELRMQHEAEHATGYRRDDPPVLLLTMYQPMVKTSTVLLQQATPITLIPTTVDLDPAGVFDD